MEMSFGSSRIVSRCGWFLFVSLLASEACAAACTAPAYEPGKVYEQGDQVQNVGRHFECWRDEEAPLGVGSWQWCRQAGYNPGLPAGNGANIWPDAWKDLGECGGFEGNRLTLNFTTLQGRASIAKPVPGVADADQVVTGVLRCKADAIPISAKSGETVHLDNLKACDYQLVMNVADGFVPLNTPRIISFQRNEGEEQAVTLKYRPPVQVSKLSGLPGIKIELFAQGLIQPRQMAMGKNVLYVGSSAIPSYVYDGKIADMIYALPLDSAGKPTGIYVIASGLEEPHGVVYRDGDLYYSTTGGLYRLRDADAHYQDPSPELVFKFPADDSLFPLPPVASGSSTRIWHMKHPLHFNPLDPTDTGLYTAVGTPCNLCMIPADPRYGTLLRYDTVTGKAQILARGVRNSVGFDWNAKTGEIWFTDNNRQGFPNPDEVNRISGPGLHFGVPYLFGKGTPGFTDEEFRNPGVIQPPLVQGAIVSDKSLEQVDPKDYVPAAFELGTNTAPLGLKFWDGYPATVHTQPMLVAVHGAGTAERPGMDIRLVTVQGGTRVVNQIPLINGFIQDPERFDVYCLDNSCVGRPVDFLELPDKSLLVSDDVAGVIYRVWYDPVGLPDTQLTLRPMLAASPELESEMASGKLISPDGNTRLFHMSLNPGDNEAALVLQGLPYGVYQVKLDDVKHWIPEQRTVSLNLSAENNRPSFNIQYRERPIKLNIKITVMAPSKPASVAAAKWHFSLKQKDLPDTAPKVMEVPWGESVTELLDYGKYEIIYPFYPEEKPQPELVSLTIDEASQDQQLALVSYRHEEKLGETVLSESCTKCHAVEYFKSLRMAVAWSAAGQDALVRQIQSMPVAGHCDSTCATQISKHLLEVVWAPYLNPADTHGQRQLRLLTRDEYVNSVRDVLAVEVNKEKLPADKSDKDFKYPGEASKGVLQAEDIKKLYDMALSIAERVAPEQLQRLKAANGTDSTTALGYQLFRRHLNEAERARYQALSDEHGEQALIAALLLSPNFLYRSELGQAVDGQSDVYKLTPYEMATALSYTYLGTTPDAQLLAKAERNELQTPQQISAEIDRMMRTERGIEQFNRFISYYIRTQRGVQEKPGLDEQKIQLMTQEQALLTREVMLGTEPTLDKLFNPGFTYLNQVLAEHYGINGVAGTAMRKVTVDDKRGGLLHLGLFQASTSDYAVTSLVKRGITIREQLFCREFGAPVEAEPTEPTFPPRAITTRERWDLVNGEQASGGRCWQCHQYMNDTGASMEHYDATGRYRQQEPAYNYAQFPQMLPIKSSGPFVGVDGTVPIDDVRDISKLIAHNSASLFCMADSYFRFASGNKSDESTSATVKALTDGLKNTGSLPSMLRTLGTSNAFQFKMQRD
jgi:glucose/arabinose dehydrogenase